MALRSYGTPKIYLPPIERYQRVIQACNQDNNTLDLEYYPGSPWIATALTRNMDRLNFCELHPRESDTLARNFQQDHRIKQFHRDGFQTAIATMPPKERRGLVLIDPPYEVKQDYDRVVEVLIACHKRFATGTYAIWYPVVKRQTIQKMLKNIQHSGMIVINPPWTLWQAMKESLPFLAKQLGGGGQGQRIKNNLLNKQVMRHSFI